MARKLFYDEENIIGYSDEIVDEFREELTNVLNDESISDDEKTSLIRKSGELISQLERYDYELVECEYYVMDDSYIVRRLFVEKD